MSEALTFEQSLKELEAIVERLQRPDVPLEDAIALYRRGTELAQQGEAMLKAAELQVQTLTRAVRERLEPYDADAEVELEDD